MKINLDIVRMGINGEGIGFWKQKPVFVIGALEGETVTLNKLELKKNYYIGTLDKVISKSKQRINSPCKLYGKCNGCSLLHATYQAQCQFKQDYLLESLAKYGPSIKPSIIKPIIKSKSHFAYRNHAKLLLKKYDGIWHAGLYASGSNRFIRLDDSCLIHDKTINETINKVLTWLNKQSFDNYDEKSKLGLRGITIRYLQKQLSIVLVTGKDSLNQESVSDLINITNACVVAQCINTKRNMVNLLDGQLKYITKEHQLKIKVNDLTIAIGCQSFFQLNYDGLLSMIDVIGKYLPEQGNLFEGYCGVGLLSLANHSKVKSGVGVEIIDNAIVSANKNAKRNRLDQYLFKCGDSAQEFRYLHNKCHFDTVLLDPPRQGLDDAMLQSLLRSNVEHVVYVSCNPSTLAKNLSILAKKYNIESIQPIDMFPQTNLVETVVLLHHKNH